MFLSGHLWPEDNSSSTKTHWWILERLKGAVKLSCSSRSGSVSLSNFMGLRGSHPRNLLMRFSILHRHSSLKSLKASTQQFSALKATLTCSWTCAVDACRIFSSWYVSNSRNKELRNYYNQSWILQDIKGFYNNLEIFLFQATIKREATYLTYCILYILQFIAPLCCFLFVFLDIPCILYNIRLDTVEMHLMFLLLNCIALCKDTLNP